MLPYIFALVSPFFYSLSSFVDKYTLDGYFEKHSIKTYMTAIGVAGVPFVLVLGVFAGSEIDIISPRNVLLAMLSGLLFNGGIAVYLTALKNSDTSLTASLFQLIVVFNYIFGRFFLGEQLSALSGLFAIMVLIGSVLLAIENDENGRTIRFKALASMLFACALISLSDVAFKSSALDGGSYISTQFFEYLTTVILGLALLASSKLVRKESKRLASKGGGILLGIILMNEFVNLIATFMQRFASVELNLTVLQTILGVQPVYLILIGYALTRLWPTKFRENIHRKNLISKSLSVLVMIVGTVGIVLSSR